AGARQVEPLLSGNAEWAGLARDLKERRPLTFAQLVGRLLRAAVRWLFTPRSRRGPPPHIALANYILSSASAATMAALVHDLEALQDTIAVVQRLPVKSDAGLQAMALYLGTLWSFVTTDFSQVHRNTAELLAMLQSGKLNRLPPLNRRVLEAAMRLESATASIGGTDHANYHAQLAAAEKVDLRMFDGHLALARSQYHRTRGEEDLALEHDARAELSFLRMGAVRGAEIQRPLSAALGYMVTRDVLGLRHCLEELAQLNARGGRYQSFCEVISGEYHRERGEHDLALAAFERARRLLHPELRSVHQSVLAGIAETQLAQRLHAEARRTAGEACAMGQDPGHFVIWARAERALALAEAAGGDAAAGVARLDGLLEKVGAVDHPATVGSLHEARALVALMQEDAPAHARHAARVEELFGSTRNPVLLARSQRVLDAGRAAQKVPSSAELASEAVTMVERPPVEATLRSSVLSGAHGMEQRLERALELLVWEAAGAGGFLYVVRDGRLALAAPFHGDEPATEITQELGRRASAGPAAGAGDPADPAGAMELPGGVQWLPVLLPIQRDGQAKVVAAAAILKGALNLRPVPAPLCMQVAEALWQAGDATAMS
ncbi:MAG TPA: hypothetical protein VND93_26395, partial [Myxococcales bacterium]|nr:hypothetical protein [Myxococcales bacterium]